MVSKEQGQAIHQAELARQTAPDRKCPKCKTQIVKIGHLCPFCGVRVEKENQ